MVPWLRRAALLSNRRHATCVMLQTWSRSYLGRRQLRNLRQLNSRAVVLQVWWRFFDAEMTNGSIVLLQKCIRRFIAKQTCTKKIEDACRRREHMATHRIQTLWRTTVRNRIKRSAGTFQAGICPSFVSDKTKYSIICTSMSGDLAKQEQRFCQRTTEEER